MRKMSKFAGLFDKYGNVTEDTERHLGKINWDGHIKLRGSFSGSAFISGYQHDFIATDLKSESNPRGSILREAKNYTDEKVATAGKTLYSHFITLQTDVGSFYLNLVNAHAEKYTQAVILKTDLDGKTVICSGYSAGNGLAQYISGNGDNLTVGIVDPSDGSTSGVSIKFITSIKDEIA